MIKNNIISIAGKQGPFENTKNALKHIDLSSLKNKKILLKPNVGRKVLPGNGYNTHPETIAAIIEVMRENDVAKIAIGESPIVGVDTLEALRISGIKDVAEKYGIELIDFDAVKPVKKEIKNGRILDSTRVCAPIFEYDVLVSVPVTKTHMHTGVTLGIKNMKGCLYRHEKVRYHQLEYKDKEYTDKTLDSAISDLATILLPDLTIVDGYIGMEGLGPSGGEAIKSDFALASWNPMGADVYACILMGLDPVSIPHLRIISERNQLSINPSDYDVVQPDYQKYIVKYKTPPTNISMKYKLAEVYDKESCSSCLSTLMLFLRRFEVDMSQYLLEDGKFHIAIGKGVDNVREGTVFVGNCTRKNKDKGIFVPGCPPVPSRIYEMISGEEPLENEPENIDKR